jgi:hypothetical protein
MDPVGLRVTMEQYTPGEGDRLNAICRKHADRMNMPRDWVIDDRRTNNPTLFKVPAPAPARRDEHVATRRKVRPFPKPESFDTLSIVRPVVDEQPIVESPLVVEPEPFVVAAPADVKPVLAEPEILDEPEINEPEINEPEISEPEISEPELDVPAPVEPAAADDVLEPTQAMPWRPRFGRVDDPTTTQQAGGRLLSRAIGSDETLFMQRPTQPKELDREPFGEHDIP